MKMLKANETYNLWKLEIEKNPDSDDARLLNIIINYTILYKKHIKMESYSNLLKKERNIAIRRWNDTHNEVKIIEPFNEEDLK